MLILIFAFVIVEVAMAYFTILSSNNNRKNTKNVATSLSDTVAQVVNVENYLYLQNKVADKLKDSPTRAVSDRSSKEEIENYIQPFLEIQDDPVFISTKKFLNDIVDANKSMNVDCIYLTYINTDDIHDPLIVFVVDSASEKACPPGWLDTLYPNNQNVITNQDAGFYAEISNTKQYGYLATAGAPIYKDGTVVGYAFVDISMTQVRLSQRDNIIRLFLYLTASILLISIIGVIVVHFMFTRYINRLNTAARAYNSDNPEETHEAFTNLKVGTHDEIAELAESMKKMENDVNNRLKELTKMNKELIDSKKETKAMAILANKDGLTGVKNKGAYINEIERINADIAHGEKTEFGIAMIDLNYLKNTNDEFGHDAGDEALIKLTNLICETFKRSPVYRIGGDEFVAILRKNDYVNADKLIKKFNDGLVQAQVDANVPDSDKVSAAIGFARFDPNTDKSVDDVFKRADKAMYNRKRDMKKPK